jgi:DnaJ-class molecular chaperone
MKCTACHGNGKVIHLNYKPGIKRCSLLCAECKGTGEVENTLKNGLVYIKDKILGDD